jgi:hypothetical protein
MSAGKTKRKWNRPLRWWEEEDIVRMLEDRRVLFGESGYLEEFMQMSTFSDILGGAKPTVDGTAIDDAEFQAQFPTVWMLMVKTADDAGKKRQVCTLTIVCEDGQAKVGLNERNEHLSLWTSSRSIGGAFAALEEALGERPVKWRRADWKSRK